MALACLSPDFGNASSGLAVATGGRGMGIGLDFTTRLEQIAEDVNAALDARLAVLDRSERLIAAMRHAVSLAASGCGYSL